MAVTIRPERSSDFDAVDTVVATAFGSPVEAKLVRNIRASELFWPHLALVATIDRTVVGHVMISGAHILNDDVRRLVATLSPLAVAPAHQRQGIGEALVRAACAVADDRGEPMVLLQGDPRYYGRFGFVPSNQRGVTMDLPDWAPVEAAQVLRLDSWSDDIRGHLILPPAFDNLD